MRIFLSFVSLCCLTSLQSQNILTVTAASQPPFNANTLIDNYFAGAGIQVLDVEFGGDESAAGFFTGGSNAIGLNRGLILSTGRAATLDQIYGAEETGIDFANTDNSSTANSLELWQVATAPIYDVLYYRITFRPNSDSIRFRYVFASEEYPEYACSAFNDVFAFFLDGPRPDSSAPYEHFNIALIPGTNLPVAINNIHPENPVSGCPSFNGQYFHNNDHSSNQPVYDGFTTPFVAEAAVVPCETYQMLIAIADVSDAIFDSSVFLEGNSFGGAIDISASFGEEENVIPENAQGDTIAISFSNIPAVMLPMSVTIGGDAINGVDYQLVDTLYTIVTSDTILHLLFQPIPDTLEENIESIVLHINGAGCEAQQYTLFISDADSTMLQDGAVLALVSGTAHLEALPTMISSTEYTFSNAEDLAIPASNMMLSSPVQVALPFTALTDIHAIQSVCLDIAHGWDDDLSIYLLAPDDRFVELSTNNGGNGDNYTGTCFSPNATQPINFPGPYAPPSAAPFTGVFQPEGDWNDILKAPVNGSWTLGVRDDNAGFNGTLLQWSITFSGEQFGRFKYLWSTGDTTTAIDVMTPGIYSVSISNAVSHQVRTFTVLDECPHTQMAPQVCAGEQFVLGDVTFDAAHPSGTVTFDLPDSDCDSTVLVQLAFLPLYADTSFAAIPAGDTLFWNGQSYTSAGFYTITLSTVNGCDSLLNLQLEITTGTQSPDAASLSIRPNPAQDQVTLSWDKNLTVHRIRLFDRFGKLVMEHPVAASAQQERLNLGQLPAGTYLLSLDTANGSVVRKLLKG